MAALVRNMLCRYFPLNWKNCHPNFTGLSGNWKARYLCMGSSNDHPQQQGYSRDPAPIFMHPEVQKLLYRVTGFNLNRIFKERPTKDATLPDYKMLTDESLKEMQDRAVERGQEHIKMPPFMKPRQSSLDVLSEDPEIEGFDTTKFVFTDITYGVPDRLRTIVIRETDGMLRHALPVERDRILHVYFPRPGKFMYMPEMFQENHLERVLSEGKYDYVLERACVQFEPDDPEFIRITHRTYEHIADHHRFDDLRSTRYFGVMTFYFVFYKKIEPLLTDMISRNMIDNAADVVQIYHLVHPECKSATEAKGSKRLNAGDLIRLFLKHDAVHGGPVELALQAYEDSQNIESRTEVQR